MSPISLPMEESLARAKLHARLDDAARRALGNAAIGGGRANKAIDQLRDALFGDGPTLDETRWSAKAHRWASADRPFPPDAESPDGNGQRGSAVLVLEPVIIHPLCGSELRFDIFGSGNGPAADLVSRGVGHLSSLLHYAEDGSCDWRRSLLAIWRFGPEIQSGRADSLSEFWRLLPADARAPDQSAWDRLDMVSAFAGAFHADSEGQCALLNVSIGPVQEFIAAARSTSDLWAGSHLLARLSWEAMRVVCERLGPDAVLFPRLRGIAQVDLWLLETGLRRELFEKEDWLRSASSDSSPLFSAALPNRFLALVPASLAREIALEIECHVRRWVVETGADMLQRLFAEAGLDQPLESHAWGQFEAQVRGFPEIHWSVVGYDELVGDDDMGATFQPGHQLEDALLIFEEPGRTGAPGFLGSETWRALSNAVPVSAPEITAAAVIYEPNPGALYPAVHDLADRTLAAAKSLRGFGALDQFGFRDSLSGEVEWLSHEAEHLALPPGQRESANTLWTRVARVRPAWARRGEHLGALSAMKRTWPTIFCDEVARVLGRDDVPRRFVVSTHAMALATTLGQGKVDSSAIDRNTRNSILAADRAALPRRLASNFRDSPEGDLLARLPSWLELEDEQRGCDDERARAVASKLLGQKPESYYALLLMDGDRMGAWLAGAPGFTTCMADVLHPRVRALLEQLPGGSAELQGYLGTPRAAALGRHQAISGALNDFAGTLARWVVEERHSGRVIYAGGDDLMAMLPTRDLLGAMLELRAAYSGTLEAGDGGGPQVSTPGFTWRGGRVQLCMGPRATASAGAVIAHHKTPLGHVLTELRRAERRAKSEGGRNAFAISILKRSGGALRYTGRWGEGHGGVDELASIDTLADTLRSDRGASRRAIYNASAWLTDMPEPSQLGGAEGMRDYLAATLGYQFARQKLEDPKEPSHSARLASLAPWSSVDGQPLSTAAAVRDRLMNLLGIAEFLGRETRA